MIVSDYAAPVPKDKFKLTWLICLLLGVGALFPWNAFITAGDYFTALFATVDFPFITALPLFFNYPNVIFMLINMAVGKRIPAKIRIAITFGLVLAVFILIPVLDWTNIVRDNPNSMMWTFLGFGAVCGLAAGVVMGTILGMAAVLPANYTMAVMSGNGIAGIIIGLLRIITKVAVERSPVGTPESLKEQQLSATIYFVISALIIVMCIIGVIVLDRLEFYQWHMRKAAGDTETQPLLTNSSMEEGATSSQNLIPTGGMGPVSRSRVLKKIWVEALEAFYAFFVTLSLFPGTIYMMQSSSTNEDFVAKGWFAIILIALFQVFDYIGRTLPSLGLFPPRKFLWIPLVARTVFFPLFVLCIQPDRTGVAGRVFNNDWYPYVFMVIFALSNGYWGTLSMIYGPTRVEDHEKETAGTIMSFFLQGGIFAGLHFAFFFLWYANPTQFYSIFDSGVKKGPVPVVSPPLGQNATALFW